MADSAFSNAYNSWATNNPRAYNMQIAPAPLNMKPRPLYGPIAGTAAYASGIEARMMQSAAGRSLYFGTQESVGFHIEGGMNKGFLGLRQSIGEVQSGIPSSFGGFTSTGKMNAALEFYAKADAAAVAGKPMGMAATSAKGMARIAGKTAFKAIPVLSTAYFMYTDYQENGVMGAIGGLAKSIAWSAGIRMAGALVPPPAIMAAVGLALGTYALGEAGRAHARGLREMEMGGGGQIMDALSSAGAATSRQRAATALNNTHLNGRMAMGNEALLMHTPFR